MTKKKTQDLHLLTARELVPALAEGAISAVDLASACLQRVAEREPIVQAFETLDPDYVLEQAALLDDWRLKGRLLGPLHGIPVALKDIIDTGDMPTQNGLVQDAGRRARDASIVEKLRAAGALIFGKTTTTEAAYYQPAKTRNPHNVAHTPGGSSAGSAAAIADFMVPLAVGTQTNGSIIRPASFCGVVGFKPGFGQIARTGILKAAPSLDQVGTFTRSVFDAALLADVLCGHDGVDESVVPMPAPQLARIAAEKVPVRPVFAFVAPPGWNDAPPDARAAFAELCDILGDQIDVVELPAIFDECLKMQQVVMAVEMSRHLGHYGEGGAPISEHLRKIIADGRAISAHDYLAARDWQGVLRSGLDQVFSRYNAILTPATYGEAPASLAQTGDPRACTLWSFTGLPAVTLPLLVGASALPIGVQLVGEKNKDGHLLRTANWLVDSLNGTESQGRAEGERDA